MGLALEKESDTGALCVYQKVTRIEIFPALEKSNIDLSFYVSKEKADLGKGHEMVIGFFSKGENFPFTEEALSKKSAVQIAYETIKKSNMVDGVEMNEFAIAQDVLEPDQAVSVELNKNKIIPEPEPVVEPAAPSVPLEP